MCQKNKENKINNESVGQTTFERFTVAKATAVSAQAVD